MLGTRILTSVAGLAALVIVILSGDIVFTVAVFVLTLTGMYEFYNSISKAGYKPVKIIGYVSCLLVLAAGLSKYTEILPDNAGIYLNFLLLAIFLVMLILFTFIIILHTKYNLVDISLTLFGVAYVTFLFIFIVLARYLQNGIYYIWLIFIGGWVTDTFAYFSGRFFGKTKLLPVISPKKTVEGSIGGIAGCVAITVLYGYFLNAGGYLNNIPLYHFVIIGLLCAVISQVGDWTASAVKRFTKIKDYSGIMPGHGGVLDRFDSIMFVAPTVYFYIYFIIM